MSDIITNTDESSIQVIFNMPCGKHIEPIEVQPDTLLVEAMQTRMLNPAHYNVYSIDNGEDDIDPYTKILVNNEEFSPLIFFLLPFAIIDTGITDLASMDSWENPSNEMEWSHVNIPLDTLGMKPSIHPLPLERLLIHPMSPHENNVRPTEYDRFCGTTRLFTLNDVYIVNINECICYNISLPIEDIPTNRFRYMEYDETANIMYVILDDPDGIEQPGMIDHMDNYWIEPINVWRNKFKDRGNLSESGAVSVKAFKLNGLTYTNPEFITFTEIPLPDDVPPRVYYDPLTRVWDPPDFVYKIKSICKCFDNNYRDVIINNDIGVVAIDVGDNTGRYIRRLSSDYYVDYDNESCNYNVYSSDNKIIDQLYHRQSNRILAFANNLILIENEKNDLQLYNYLNRTYVRSIPLSSGNLPTNRDVNINYNSFGLIPETQTFFTINFSYKACDLFMLWPKWN